MTASSMDIWNERYGKADYAYGVLPNEYLKAQLAPLNPGTILFPAEGEGRNAVYAATLGWSVYAFDQSAAGKQKAMALAHQKGVSIDYTVAEVETITYTPAQFDVIALIYAHFPANKRASFHSKLDTYLKPGGTLILEAFSKNHLAYNSRNEKVGGPRDINLLYSLDDLRSDFPNYELQELKETEVLLNEGLYHIGEGSVIRFTGKKC